MELNQNILNTIETYYETSKSLTDMFTSEDAVHRRALVSTIINDSFFPLFCRNLIVKIYSNKSEEEIENINQEYLQWYSDLSKKI